MNTTDDYGESDFPSCNNCESIGQPSIIGKSFSSTCMKIDFLSQSTNNMQQCLAKCYDCMQECEEESRRSVMDSKCGVGIGAACAATTVDNYSFMPKCCVCNMPTCQCDLMGISIPQASVDQSSMEYMNQQQPQAEEQVEEEEEQEQEEEEQSFMAQPSKNTCLLAKQNGKKNDQCLLIKQCKLIKGKTKGKKTKGKSKKKQHDCNELQKMLREHEKSLNGDNTPIKCYKNGNDDNNNNAMDVEKDSQNACPYLRKYNELNKKKQKPVCLLTRNPYKVQKSQVKKKNPLPTIPFTGSSAQRRPKQCTCGLFPCKCCIANWSLPKLQCLDPTTTPSAFMDGCNPELACVPNTYASFATPELLNWKSPFAANMNCQPQGNPGKFKCLSHGSRETEDNSQINECLKAIAQACAAQNDDDMDDSWDEDE